MYGNLRSPALEYNSHRDVWIQFERFIGTHKDSLDCLHTLDLVTLKNRFYQDKIFEKSVSVPFPPSFIRKVKLAGDFVCCVEVDLVTDHGPLVGPRPFHGKVPDHGYWQSDPRQSPHIPRGTPAESGETGRMVTGRAARGASAVMVLYHGADLEI